MEAYITGLGIVSPQHTFQTSDFLAEIVAQNGIRAKAIEPSYKTFLDPILARRMGRIIKMSIAASAECLADAQLEQPDAIVTGTALGCLNATETFLLSVINDQEQFLTPTSFIQSIHNTVSGQIALQLKCTGYNFTYVHSGASFESALLDALLSLAEGSSQTVLVGGHEEQTDNNFEIYNKLNYWRKQPTEDLQLITKTAVGTMNGEGAAFFLLSSTPHTKNYARLNGLTTIYQNQSATQIEAAIGAFLAEKGLKLTDIDLVLLGNNGHVTFDAIYHQLQQTTFSNTPTAYFKHLCGEYQTVGSFALWVAAKIIYHQTVPAGLGLKNEVNKPKNILIYNHYQGEIHCLYLVCGL